MASRLGNDNALSRIIETRAKQDIKKIVFADADNPSVLKAAQVVNEERIANPILLGNRRRIEALLDEYNISLPQTPIIDPQHPQSEEDAETMNRYVQKFYDKRKRKGFTRRESEEIMLTNSYYGSMMVDSGDADAMIGGLSKKYPHTLRPALQIIGPQDGVKKVASMHILVTRHGPLFLADTSINHFLTANDIADITELVHREVKALNIRPRIALVTYSNFGSVPNGESAILMRKATAILHQKHPDWLVDGEMQAHMALDPELLERFYPFSRLTGHRANVLIFPSLSSANIAYNLLSHTANLPIIGPILLGLKKPVHILQLGASVRQIVEMVGMAAIHAQNLPSRAKKEELQ